MIVNIKFAMVVNENLQPPSDKKKKEEMLRKREQRMMQAMAERLVNILLCRTSVSNYQYEVLI